MPVIGKDVAEKQFDDILEDLGIQLDTFADDDGKKTRAKIVSGIMSGILEYEKMSFKQRLLSPIELKDKKIEFINISEPTGSQLREMASVKDKNDDTGKGMAVLGAVSGLGLPIINKMGSRDLLLSVSVIGLFL